MTNLAITLAVRYIVAEGLYLAVAPIFTEYFREADSRLKMDRKKASAYLAAGEAYYKFRIKLDSAGFRPEGGFFMKLVLSKTSAITVATNTFINVPVIVQYDDTPLIEVVNQQALEFTTQLSVFHQDGTYLAKVKGNRVFPTKEGKKSKIDVIIESSKYVCTLDGKPIFELSHETGENFKADAELYTPTGYFVKFNDNPQPSIMNTCK